MRLTLREWRLRRKLTQDELSDLSGVDQTHISSIEIGRRTPSDEVQEKLARALGIAPSKIRLLEPEPVATVVVGSDRSGQDNNGHRGAR